jgi:PAS domain S-box-containing protein
MFMNSPKSQRLINQWQAISAISVGVLFVLIFGLVFYLLPNTFQLTSGSVGVILIAATLLAASSWEINRRFLKRTKLSIQSDHVDLSVDLKKVEDCFHRYAETSKGWFWETDWENRLIFLSSYFYTVTGILPKDVLGKTRGTLRLDSIDTSERHKWQEHQKKIDSREPFENFEYSSYKANGEVIIFRTSGKPNLDEHFVFQGFQGSGLDITHEVETERNLHHMQELIYEATSILNDGFILFDADERTVMCNQRFRDIYPQITNKLEPGINFGQIIQAMTKRIMTFDNEQSREDSERQRLLDYKNPGTPIDQKMANVDWIRIIEQKLPNGGTVGLRIDITEINRRDEELQLAQHIASIGSWHWNVTDDTLISCSPEYALIHGVPLDTINDHLAHQFERIVHEDDRDRVLHEFIEIDKHNQSYEVEYRIYQPNGVVRYVVERGQPSIVKNNRVVEQLGTLQDITERKRQEKEFHSNKQLLEAAIEEIPGGFVLVNADGLIDRFNRKLIDRYPQQLDVLKQGLPYLDFFRTGIEKSVYKAAIDDNDWLEKRMEQFKFDTVEHLDRLQNGRWIRVAGRTLADYSRVGIHTIHQGRFRKI